MIITFCGHSQFKRTESLERRVLEFLENKIGNEAADHTWANTAILTVLHMTAVKNTSILTKIYP